jgi:hypothetical protein
MTLLNASRAQCFRGAREKVDESGALLAVPRGLADAELGKKVRPLVMRLTGADRHEQASALRSDRRLVK